MAGPDPFDPSGQIVPIRAVAARQSAGIVDYNREHDQLQRKLDAMAVKPTGRLSIPQRNPDILPQIAAILIGAGNEILAFHNQYSDPEMRLSKLWWRVREAEQKLRELL